MALKTPTNLSNYTPSGQLGTMFTKARTYNHINDQLSKILPSEFSTLKLCAIDKETAILITNNQALAFRAQKQAKLIIQTLRQLQALSKINKVIIKLDQKINSLQY